MTWQGSVLSADIGGTKIAAARVTGTGQVVARRREATTADGPAALIAQLARLLGELREDDGTGPARAVGLGIPAVLEHGTDRVIWAPNIPDCRDVDLGGPLEAALGIPVFLEYDGHTAVLGEWWQGVGRGYQNVVFVIIGTGIGGGLILNGRLVRGHDRLAGAAGWFVLTTDPGAADAARSRGHWESLAAGPGIARRAQAAGAGGREWTAEGVFAEARAGEAWALALVAETARIIGLGVANIVSLVNPDVVILGGGIGTQGDLILEPVRQVVRDWAQPISGRGVRVEASRLGEEAGLLGAAYAAFERAAVEKGGPGEAS